MIKDSGHRREFDTGAVRDMQEGKGRCDLLPLDVVSEFIGNSIVLAEISSITNKAKEKDIMHLLNSLLWFCDESETTQEKLILEVVIHFEEGCKKYGERNWEKGIKTSCYIDSAIRHYLKWRLGETDERHDRAFAWNILCCIWTIKHKPELHDFGQAESEG